jgi:FkbM family methyltransferase
MKRIIQKLYNLYIRRPWNTAEYLLERFAARNQDVIFMQIGANDGVDNDPFHEIIRKYEWSGLCVEPQPLAYEKLARAYETNGRIRTINAAITDRAGIGTMFKVSFSDKRWASGLTSFKREVIASQIKSGYVRACAHKHGDSYPPSVEEWIDTLTVRTMTFEQLFNGEQVQHVDALLIDTEGYELTLLNLWDFKKRRPGIIIVERMHMTRQQRQDVCDLLQGQGYRIAKTERNFVAMRLVG